MKEELRKHKIAYALLAIFLAAGAVSYMLVWPNRSLQRTCGVALASGYFIWGVVTHTKSNHLTMRIVLEYASVALFAGMALALVTY